MFLTILNTEIVAYILSLLFKKSRHNPNLESTSKYGFSFDFFFWGGGGEWRRSEHAHASYPGLSFRRPGSAPIGEGKKGEFRDWTTSTQEPNTMASQSALCSCSTKWGTKLIVPIYFGTKTCTFCFKIFSLSSLESELSFDWEESEINFAEHARQP